MNGKVNVQSWNTQQVGKWLEEHHFKSYKQTFLDNNIDGSVLLELHSEHLKDLDIHSFADKVAIADAIRRLRAAYLRQKLQIPSATDKGHLSPTKAELTSSNDTSAVEAGSPDGSGRDKESKKTSWKSHGPAPPHIITPRSSSMKNHSDKQNGSAVQSPSYLNSASKESATVNSVSLASSSDMPQHSQSTDVSPISDGSFDGFRASTAQQTQPLAARPFHNLPKSSSKAMLGEIHSNESPTSPNNYVHRDGYQLKESIWKRLGKSHKTNQLSSPTIDAGAKGDKMILSPVDKAPLISSADNEATSPRYLKIIGRGNQTMLIDCQSPEFAAAISDRNGSLLRTLILQKFGLSEQEWSSHALLRPPKDNDAHQTTKISDVELLEIAKNPKYLCFSDTSPHSGSKDAIYLRKQHIFLPATLQTPPTSASTFPSGTSASPLKPKLGATALTVSSSDDEPNKFRKKDLHKYFGENIAIPSATASAGNVLSRERSSSLNTRFAKSKVDANSGDRNATSSRKSRLFGRHRSSRSRGRNGNGVVLSPSDDSGQRDASSNNSSQNSLTGGSAASSSTSSLQSAVKLTPTNARKIESLMGATTHQIFGERPTSETIAGNLEMFFGKVSKPLQHKINEQVRMSRMSRAMDWQSVFQIRLSQRQSQLYSTSEVQHEVNVAKKPGPQPTTSPLSRQMPPSSSSDESDEEMRDNDLAGNDSVSSSFTNNILKTPLSASPDAYDDFHSSAIWHASAVGGLQQSSSQVVVDSEDGVNSSTYQLGQVIGQGSFGKVYLAVNLETGQLMAVKQVELPTAGTVKAQQNRQKMVDALMREVEVLKECQHPNIVQYIGTYNNGNFINVVLEYVSGGSVSSLIQKIGKFEEPLVRHLVPQILLGLEYLHDKALIHRDIKGANILITERGDAKISDFGISKRNEYQFAYRFNSRMSVQGSVFWMAPEVVKAKGYSAKVDIWSLGCVVLEMYTGSHPWRKFDEVAAMYRIGTMNAPPIPADLSQMTRDFLTRCFILNPEQRPTASVLLDDPFSELEPEFKFADYYEEAFQRQQQAQAAQAAQADCVSSPDSNDDYSSDSGSVSSAYSRRSESTNSYLSSSSSVSGSDYDRSASMKMNGHSQSFSGNSG